MSSKSTSSVKGNTRADPKTGTRGTDRVLKISRLEAPDMVMREEKRKKTQAPLPNTEKGDTPVSLATILITPSDAGTGHAGDTKEKHPLTVAETQEAQQLRGGAASLRIKTQLRQASVAEEMSALTTSDCLEDLEDRKSTDGRFSLNNSSSAGPNRLMNGLPKRANEILQEAKAELERSGNLKREIRENVVASLQELYEMVLRLADSRILLMLEAHRTKPNETKNIDRIRAKHTNELKDALNKYEELDGHILTLNKDTEMVRQIILRDVHDELAKVRQNQENSSKEIKNTLTELNTQVQNINSQITNIQMHIGTNTANTLPELEEVNRRIQEVQDTLLHFTQVPKKSTEERQDKTPIETSYLRDTIQKSVETALEISELGVIKELCSDTNQKMAETKDNTATLLGRTNKDEEMGRALKSEITKIKDDIADLRDVSVEAVAPIRTAIEEIRGEIKTSERRSNRIPENVEGQRKSKIPSRVPPTDPNWPIVLESVDPRSTSDDIIKNVKGKVDPVALGIAINGIRKIRNQKAIVCCDSEKDRKAFCQALKNAEPKLSAKIPSTKNPLLKLPGVANDMTNSQIEEAVIKLNKRLLVEVENKDLKVKVQRRTKGRNSLVANVILEVNYKIWTRLKDQRLKIGYQVVTATDHSPIRQCYNCLGFGHLARDCNQESNKCGYCAQQHDSRICANKNGPPTCANCKKETGVATAHPAYSRECPIWQKWDRIARAAVKYC
ncbi:uncharacterized protein LOC110386478 [Bombyx mori]|uniref:CCHC-type domain-containing protein n=1 Tax=Bombyx mori TaxID=7091 RepID=A0A8R2HR35_BOMMO|nr:uncharacterized protein LOC110386478 [Bombyx mori]